MPSVQNFFETKAKTGEWKSLYDLNNPTSYPFVIRIKKTTEMLSEHISGKKVCDLGCGTGALIPFVSENKAHYTGVDFSAEMLSKIKNNDKIDGSKIKLINMDFKDGNFSESFDILVGLGFIEYFENPKEIIKKCNKILNENGLILLSFPNRLCLDFTLIRSLFLIRFFLKKFFKIGKDNPRRKMWSYNEAIKLFEHGEFEILSIKNYYTNLLVYPFTVIFPKLAFKISSVVEKTFLNKVKFLNGGFLILAKKKF